ncbi:MAG: hypothetical protein ACFFCW_16515 [Candidatus Hodarchaeota archaeon]
MVQLKPLKIVIISLFFACLFGFGFIGPAAALPVFPGAVGFGTDTSAGYYRPGGKTPAIYIVTSTNHASGTPALSERNGISVRTGTLLQCIRHDPGTNVPKIILFEVSGTITATSSPYTYDIDHPYTTIAGQTAPSPGITLKNIRLRVRKAHDVLIQHIRSRIGDMSNGEDPDVRRSFSVGYVVGDDPYNVVIDHVSASWAPDINIGIGASKNVTVSNSIISEGLDDSIHSKGPHSKGLSSSEGAINTFYYRNLLAHNKDRNPYLQDGKKVVLNNIIYNPGEFNCIIQSTGSTIDASIVNNLFIAGSNTVSSAAQYAPVLWEDLTSTSSFYINGNENRWGSKSYVQTSSADWSHVRNSSGISTSRLQITSPEVWVSNATVLSTAKLEDKIVADAGARPFDRDTVDKRIINDLKNRTGKIIDSPSQVGGWPSLAGNKRTLSIPQDPNGDKDGDGYTNIEEWIHNYSQQVAESDGTVTLEAPVLKVAGSNP